MLLELVRLARDAAGNLVGSGAWVPGGWVVVEALEGRLVDCTVVQGT